MLQLLGSSGTAEMQVDIVIP